jgi:putative membrane protein
MGFIVKLLLSSIAVFITSYLLPGVNIDSLYTAIIVAIVLALLNAIVKPILIILTIPITIVTLGLFLLVINAAIILIAESFIDGFHVDGFWWALAFSLIISFINSVFDSLSKEKE